MVNPIKKQLKRSQQGSSSALAIVIVAIILAAVILAYFAFQVDDDDEDEDDNVNGDQSIFLTIISKDGTISNMTMDQVTSMPSIEKTSSYQNRFGNWNEEELYKGVKLSTIVDQAGGMDPGDTLRISADDYAQDFCYLNVFPDDDWYSIQGDLVIAYSLNNVAAPEWDEGPKSALLPADGKYSNQDCNWTSAVNQGYNLNPSGGARWVKNVNKIEIIDGDEDWYINLTGSSTKKLYRTEFKMFKNWYEVSQTDSSDLTWSGVPINRILGLVDGGDARGDSGPNSTLGSTEYFVSASAIDGYAKQLLTTWVYQNDQIFLADELDEQSLDSDNGPIRISGHLPSKSYMVRQLRDLEIDLTPIPEWELTINGLDKNLTLSMAELMVMKSYKVTAGFLKVTGTIVGPDEFRAVKVLDILEEVGAEGNYSLNVIPTDFYNMTFTKGQVEGEIDIFDSEGNNIGTGGVTMYIAYEKNGEQEFTGELPRIIYANDDGVITDGHFWVKEVMQIDVEVDTTVEWDLNLSGLTDFKMDRSTYEAIANCDWHRMSYIDDNGDEWMGVPLWVLVSTVDGNDTHTGHAMGTFSFNDSLVEVGYNVSVIAGDGYTKIFHSSQMARNDTIIVAYMVNDERLSGKNWPLRLVGDGLSKSQMVGNIIEIRIKLD
jgi:hypothetical protein